MNQEKNINGLNPRHVAQIIRRKMIQKPVNSKKMYRRTNEKHKV